MKTNLLLTAILGVLLATAWSQTLTVTPTQLVTISQSVSEETATITITIDKAEYERLKGGGKALSPEVEKALSRSIRSYIKNPDKPISKP